MPIVQDALTSPLVYVQERHELQVSFGSELRVAGQGGIGIELGTEYGVTSRLQVGASFQKSPTTGSKHLWSLGAKYALIRTRRSPIMLSIGEELTSAMDADPPGSPPGLESGVMVGWTSTATRVHVFSQASAAIPLRRSSGVRTQLRWGSGAIVRAGAARLILEISGEAAEISTLASGITWVFSPLLEIGVGGAIALHDRHDPHLLGRVTYEFDDH